MRPPHGVVAPADSGREREVHSLRGAGRYFHSGQAGHHIIVRVHRTKNETTGIIALPNHIGRLSDVFDCGIADLAPDLGTFLA